MWKYKDVFKRRPGWIDVYEHELEIKKDKPYFMRSYPIPMMFRDPVEAEIKRMLELGIIQRSKTPYINPLVVIAKKDKEVRLCLDARQVNKIMQPDHECAQSSEILFQKCQNVKFMSILDSTASFWQIPLHPDSYKYTAFQYNANCHEFTVTPFGLKTSLASLVRGLDMVVQ